MILQGVKNAYEVGSRVAITDTYRLYLAKDVGTGTGCLLQVAKGFEQNGGLSRASFILDELADMSRHYDELYAKMHDGKHLHYDRLFPQKVESFVAEEQANRRVNILALTDVDNINRLLPLSNLLTKDRVILDLKSGAWIMGRLLKLLDFVHPLGIALRSLRSNNVLLEPDQHFAIVLDWTKAFVFQTVVSPEVATTDIACAARAVLASCGIPEQGQLPYMLGDGEDQYVGLLRDFANASESDARQAHAQFYQICHQVWGVEFHPFTTLPLL